jgi:hypothetical protein
MVRQSLVDGLVVIYRNRVWEVALNGAGDGYLERRKPLVSIDGQAFSIDGQAFSIHVAAGTEMNSIADSSWVQKRLGTNRRNSSGLVAARQTQREHQGPRFSLDVV